MKPGLNKRNMGPTDSYIGYRHLSLKIPNIEFNINALIGNLTLGIQY